MPHKEKLASEMWCAKLAYLADIFAHLNELTTKIQGRNENILTTVVPGKTEPLARGFG